jgi:hypothetical protein
MTDEAQSDLPAIAAHEAAEKARLRRQVGELLSAIMEEGSFYLELRRFRKYADGREGDFIVAGNWNHDVREPRQAATSFGYACNRIARGDFSSARDWLRERKWREHDELVALIAEYDWTGLDFDEDDNITVAALIEQVGGVIEWCDQVDECCQCNGCVQTEPDSYGWLPQFYRHDDGLTCASCVEDDPSDYLESLEGNPRTANTLGLDLASHEYAKLDQEFESGWHPGQDDSPELAAKVLEAKGVSRFIFQIDDQGQFDTRWSVWIHEDDRELLALDEELAATGPSNSARLSAQLQEVSAQWDAHAQAQREQGGVVVSKLRPDGVTTRLVSREDFIAGKALDDAQDLADEKE